MTLNLKNRDNIAIVIISLFTIFYTLAFIILPQFYDVGFCRTRCEVLATKTWGSFGTGTHIEYGAWFNVCHQNSSKVCAIDGVCKWYDEKCKQSNTGNYIPKPDLPITDYINLGLYLVVVALVIYCIKEGEHGKI